MPDIRRLRGTGACGYDLAANPTLLLQQTEARRHKDGERAGRHAILPRRFLFY